MPNDNLPCEILPFEQYDSLKECLTAYIDHHGKGKVVGEEQQFELQIEVEQRLEKARLFKKCKAGFCAHLKKEFIAQGKDENLVRQISSALKGDVLEEGSVYSKLKNLCMSYYQKQQEIKKTEIHLPDIISYLHSKVPKSATELEDSLEGYYFIIRRAYYDIGFNFSAVKVYSDRDSPPFLRYESKRTSIASRISMSSRGGLFRNSSHTVSFIGVATNIAEGHENHSFYESASFHIPEAPQNTTTTYFGIYTGLGGGADVMTPLSTNATLIKCSALQGAYDEEGSTVSVSTDDACAKESLITILTKYLNDTDLNLILTELKISIGEKCTQEDKISTISIELLKTVKCMVDDTYETLMCYKP